MHLLVLNLMQHIAIDTVTALVIDTVMIIVIVIVIVFYHSHCDTWLLYLQSVTASAIRTVVFTTRLFQIWDSV